MITRLPDLKILASFNMEKLLKILFIICAFPVFSYAQDLGKQLDYQYRRDIETYHAYALYQSNNQEVKTIDLLLTTTFDVGDLQKIFFNVDGNLIKLPFKKSKITVPIDDKDLYNLLVRIDLSDLVAGKNCEQFIVFNFSKNRKVSLPIELCKLINL